jgi:hypothetical protein
MPAASDVGLVPLLPPTPVIPKAGQLVMCGSLRCGLSDGPKRRPSRCGRGCRTD